VFKRYRLKKNFNFFFLSLVFEKNDFLYYENNNLFKNSQYILVSNQEFYPFVNFFVETKPSILLDMFSYDMFFLKNMDFLLKDKINLIYYFYSFKLNCYKYICNYNNIYMSCNNLFKNSIWLEREQMEFFGINFFNIKDCRNLFLEYNNTDNVLLKKYSVSENNNIWKIFYEKLAYEDNIYNSL